MNNRIAFCTIVGKEIRRFGRIWVQTLLPPIITTSLYFIIFGELIGKRLGDIGGGSYMQFIAPGIILMSVISHSYSNVVGSFYSSKFQRHIEELLVAPVANWVILLGYICGGMARGLLVGLIVTLISLLFTDISVYNWGITIAIYILTSALFALAGFLNAIFADSFDAISIVPNFILTPLSYLGGVFYSLAMLPDIWQKVSLFNPILYLVNTLRYGLIGVADIDIKIGFGVVLACIFLLVATNLILLAKGVGIKN